MCQKLGVGGTGDFQTGRSQNTGSKAEEYDSIGPREAWRCTFHESSSGDFDVQPSLRVSEIKHIFI